MIMTQEEKQLLLKDLSARLPYGVVVNYKEGEYDWHCWKITTLYAPVYSESGMPIDTDNDGWIGYDEYKGAGMSIGSAILHLGKILPYLRPMSSMTMEEETEYSFLLSDGGWGVSEELITQCIDWLNKKMFDYRGLIEKGLAIEVTKENNPYKENKL